MNPQKLAGQCGKLKCCLNHEVDAYSDAQKDFPPTNIPLNTGDGILYHQKTDIFGKIMTFSSDKEGKGVLINIPVKRVKEIIALHRQGNIPAKTVEETENAPEDIKYTDGVGEESLNRFDEKKQPKKRKSRHKNNANRTSAEPKEQRRQPEKQPNNKTNNPGGQHKTNNSPNKQKNQKNKDSIK